MLKHVEWCDLLAKRTSTWFIAGLLYEASRESRFICCAAASVKQWARSGRFYIYNSDLTFPRPLQRRRYWWRLISTPSRCGPMQLAVLCAVCVLWCSSNERVQSRGRQTVSMRYTGLPAIIFGTSLSRARTVLSSVSILSAASSRTTCTTGPL